MNLRRLLLPACFIITLSDCGGEIGPELQEPYNNPKVVEELIAAAPRGWSLAETKPDRIPWGHHQSDGYKGHGGTKLILVGPNPVSLHWRDQTGNWHDDPIAKESLEIWVLPSEYREGKASILDPNAKVPAELVSASRSVRIYAIPSHRLNSESEFNVVLGKANATSWPASPYGGTVSLSWKTWQADLAKALADGT